MNIGNLGIPIAVYVLGDIAYVAPVLLFQLLLLAPIGMAVLDTIRQGTVDHWWSPIWTIAKNPIVIGAVAGIAVSGTGFEVPPVLFDPLSMVGRHVRARRAAGLRPELQGRVAAAAPGHALAADGHHIDEARRPAGARVG